MEYLSTMAMVIPGDIHAPRVTLGRLHHFHVCMNLVYLLVTVTSGALPSPNATTGDYCVEAHYHDH